MHRRKIAFAVASCLFVIAAMWLVNRTGRSPLETSRAAASSAPSRTSPESAPAATGDFRQWLETAVSTTPSSAVLAEGLRLARERRLGMESLMRSDPRRALAESVTLAEWRKLPPEIRAEVEEPFSALAELTVAPVCNPAEGQAAAVRWIEIEGAPALETFVYGRREGLDGKRQAPLQGIRLGTLVALREEVFQTLNPADTAIAAALYPLANPRPELDFATGGPLGKTPVTALAGGQRFLFSSSETLARFEAEIGKLDESPGPNGGSGLMFLPSPQDPNLAGFDLGAAIALNQQLASAWTETKKKVFVIRCDFPDKTNAAFPVVNAGTYATTLNTSVADNIRAFSYGKTWIEAEVSSDITRLPQASTFYAADQGGGNSRNSELLSAAKAAYQTSHPAWQSSTYDIVGIWFVSIGMQGSGVTYAGLAGGGNLWIQGTSSVDVHVHEFGHNYGIGHSSFWKVSPGSTNPLDPAATSVEYGDPFDVMGGGAVPTGHFHAEAKQRLNWLAAGDWTDATAGGSGTYRIRRIDDANAAGVRGLRVTRAADDYFWLSFRRGVSSNPWLQAGANLVWKRPGETRSWLVDTTPGSRAGDDDKTDSAIPIGTTFSNGNVHITPLARGGTAPDEYLDVRVNAGPFPGNLPPVVTIEGPTVVSPRLTTFFTASATDANGDALSYSWDFGAGFEFENNPEAAFAWELGGAFTVKVTVSDMKGGVAVATKIVTVTDPLSTWTDRPNVSVGDFKALAANPTTVLAVGNSFTGNFRGPAATSADGIVWTTGTLGNNQQGNGATWDGSQFIVAGEQYSFTEPAGWLGAIFTSPSGNAPWTRRYFTGPTLRAVATGGGVRVAVGDAGTILRSTDGVTWTPISAGITQNLSGVEYGNGRFVAVGFTPNNGGAVVITSVDGASWSATSPGANVATWQDLRTIRWGGGTFVSSGWYSKLRYSGDDGTSFQTTRTTNEETPALAYGNGTWFAAGLNYSTTPETDIDLVSTDGRNWTPLTTPSLPDRNAAIFFKNTFITVGADHSIRQSGAVLPAANGYLAWRETHYPDHGPGSTPDDDPDFDNIPNLVEYAFGSPPLSAANGQAVPRAVTDASEPSLAGRLVLQVDLPSPAAEDIECIVESSALLGSDWVPLAKKSGDGDWIWLAAGPPRLETGTAVVTKAIVPPAGRSVSRIGSPTLIADEPRRFMRVRVQPRN